METRQQIRKKYKQTRNSMSIASVTQLSIQISEIILQWERYRQAESYYFYYPLGNEVSLLPVIEDAFAKNKPTAFPRVLDGTMHFYQVTSLDELEEGYFHVMEPRTADRQQVNWEHALCFVPGVVFDQSGGRFGYGKGYYDRYFSAKKAQKLVGCAYEWQVVKKLPIDVRDQCMDYLVTEKMWRGFAK